MITRDLRHAIACAVAAAGSNTGGHDRAADPGLRPTGTPGQYAASVALSLGANPRERAATLAATLAGERWIARAEVTGPGYVTITVTPEALAAVADNVIAAGPACVTSDALAGVTVPAPPPGDPLTPDPGKEGTWEEARRALAARLTARLAAAAGATIADPSHPPIGQRVDTDVARAVAFAGRDAVTFTLARAIPGKSLVIDPQIIARHVPGNPAYAVRYAHARAASGVRWAVASSAADTIRSGETQPSPFVGPRPELVGSGGYGGLPPREATVLLDALSWLPERVATAARRGRPDEFARYLEDLASVTVDVLSSASHMGSAPGSNRAPGSDRLTLAMAARTGLAAGLGLLEVTAPDRL